MKYKGLSNTLYTLVLQQWLNWLLKRGGYDIVGHCGVHTETHQTVCRTGWGTLKATQWLWGSSWPWTLSPAQVRMHVQFHLALHLFLFERGIFHCVFECLSSFASFCSAVSLSKTHWTHVVQLCFLQKYFFYCYFRNDKSQEMFSLKLFSRQTLTPTLNAYLIWEEIFSNPSVTAMLVQNMNVFSFSNNNL